MKYLAAILTLGTAAMAATPNSSVTYDIGRARSVRRRSSLIKATRRWAKAIREAVLTKKMPPWFADPRFGHFANDRRLSEADVKTLVAWVDAGAPEGDAKDMPPPIEWPHGWNIKPDAVVETCRRAAPLSTRTSWFRAVSRKTLG